MRKLTLRHQSIYNLLLSTGVFVAGFSTAILMPGLRGRLPLYKESNGRGISSYDPALNNKDIPGQALPYLNKDYIRPLRMPTFEDYQCSDNIVKSDNSRYAKFHRRPFCVPVANPVATEAIWTPAVNAPKHRVVLSLPGTPPINWTLPDDQGRFSVAFVPPENPNRTEDVGELWFECQPLPASANLDTYIFQWVDYTEWTATRPTVKLICNGVGVLKLIAYLDKPYILTLSSLKDIQRAQVCTDCNLTVLGGGVAGSLGGPEGVAAGMAGAAIGSKDCRECLRDRIEAIAQAAQAAAAVAAAAKQEQERVTHEREAKDAFDRAREMDRNNRACEDYERWGNIA